MTESNNKITAERVEDIGEGTHGGLVFNNGKVLWRLSEKMTVDGEEFDHVITSSACVMGMPETYAFPATPDGKIADWGELPGSSKGDISHEQVINDVCRMRGKYDWEDEKV